MSIIRTEGELPIVDFTAPEWIGDKHVEGLTKEAGRMKAHIDKAVPNKQAYQSNIGIPSSKFFGQLFNPSFHTKSGLDGSEVIVNQQANLMRSYDTYKLALDIMYETRDGEAGKLFKEMVTRKKGNYLRGVSERTLPFTGVRMEMLGAAVIIDQWLVGNQEIIRFLRGGDHVNGQPFLITDWRRAPQLKAALMGRLTQAGAQIIKANYSLPTITNQNTITNQLIQGFIDPTLGLDPFTPAGPSYVKYEKRGTRQLWLTFRVSQV